MRSEVTRRDEAERLDPRTVGAHRLGLVGPPEEHRAAGSAREGGGVLEEARLAHPGIAPKHQELTLGAQRGRGRALLEERALVAPAEERHGGREGRARTRGRGRGRHDRRRCRRCADRGTRGEELGRGLAAERRLLEPPAALELLDRVGAAAEPAEDADRRDVGLLGEGIDRDAGARVAERLLGRRRLERGDERVERRDPHGPQRLALAAEPGLEARTVREIQAFEQVAAHRDHDAAELVDRAAAEDGGVETTRALDVNLGAARLERDVDAIGEEARLAPAIDHRAKLGEAPAQGGARVIGPVPEEIAEAFAEDGPSRHDEVTEQRARLP